MRAIIPQGFFTFPLGRDVKKQNYPKKDHFMIVKKLVGPNSFFVTKIVTCARVVFAYSGRSFIDINFIVDTSSVYFRGNFGGKVKERHFCFADGF